MKDLFDQQAEAYYREHAPLAERMRPSSLSEYFGQDDIVGEGHFLRRMIEADEIRSLILWGPPGTGKTTLAQIIAAATGRRFVPISAVASGVKDLQRIIKEARESLKFEQRGTILFVDEIHRFNKAQQDVLLHSVEDGTLTLIGATTENPSFEVNSALLSRMQIVVLEALSVDSLRAILDRALCDNDRGLGKLKLEAPEDTRTLLANLAAGDARRLLNYLEQSAILCQTQNAIELTPELVKEAIGKRSILYDKSGEEHYNVISAFIKSMRGSDPDAALYYLARMMEGGEDPLFIARRLVIFASEDIGNADPQALMTAIACKEATHFVGLPECFYALSQCTVYLATAAKSNASGAGYGRAMAQVREQGPLAVPLHIRNAPTRMMKDMGYGKNYHYPHMESDGIVPDSYLPEEMQGKRFYKPTDHGYEKTIAEQMREIEQRKQDKSSESP